MASPEEAQIIQMLGVLLERLAGMEQLMSGRLDQVQQRLDRVEHLVSAGLDLYDLRDRRFHIAFTDPAYIPVDFQRDSGSSCIQLSQPHLTALATPPAIIFVSEKAWQKCRDARLMNAELRGRAVSLKLTSSVLDSLEHVERCLDQNSALSIAQAYECLLSQKQVFALKEVTKRVQEALVYCMFPDLDQEVHTNKTYIATMKTKVKKTMSMHCDDLFTE